jgi:hypothetical protein
LELYLKVFQNLVWNAEYDDKTIMKARQLFFLLARSETFALYKKNMTENFRKIIDDKAEIFDFFDESLENLYGENKDYKSSYEIMIQKEFAYAFLQYLTAGNSKSNYYFLLNHAFIKTLDDLERKKENSTLKDFEYNLLDYMHRFLRTQNDKKRMELLQKMGTHRMVSPYSNQDVDLFVMFGSAICYSAYGILMRIPYMKILQENPQNLKKINLEELINECSQKSPR